jgi:hypothetical protein
VGGAIQAVNLVAWIPAWPMALVMWVLGIGVCPRSWSLWVAALLPDRPECV